MENRIDIRAKGQEAFKGRRLWEDSSTRHQRLNFAFAMPQAVRTYHPEEFTVQSN